MAYTTDKKPGELTPLTTLATDDVIVVGDTSDASEVAKGITKANLITDLSSSFSVTGHTHTGVYATKVGTPVDNQIGVWTGDGTIEGDAALTFDTSTDTLTVPNAVINTGIVPDANDGAYIGTSTLRFSDVFLANGGVLNWDDGGSSQLTVTNANYGILGITTTEQGEDGLNLQLIQASATPAANDIPAKISFVGRDSASNNHTYGSIRSVIADTTNTSEDGSVVITTSVAGAQTDRITADANGVSITGALSAGSTIELGHASDTTISRVSAGVVAVEGNNIVTANNSASASDINTGTSTTKFNTPDALAGSYAGTKSLSVQVFDGTTDVATGDGKAYITIPEALNGMNLIRAQATVVTAGTTNATTVMIHNKTDSQDMLSGAISIASGGTVGTVGTVNTSYDDVATNDVLRIDVDSVSTTAPKGLMVVLEFRLP